MACVKSVLMSWILRMLILDVTCTYGLNACRGDLITNISLSTELQSEVLLPCSFESDLLKSSRTNETCAVWTHLHTADFVEINLDGEAKFWNNRRGRIKTFPKLLESELLDFSILIRNVQQSDLGVYHCKLFRETNCFLAYKIIEIHKAVSVNFWWPWMITAGAAGGGVVLVLIIIAINLFKRQAVNEVTYASIIHRSHNSNESNVLVNDDLINGSTEDSVHVSSDTVLYSTVKRGHKKKNTTSELSK